MGPTCLITRTSEDLLDHCFQRTQTLVQESDIASAYILLFGATEGEHSSADDSIELLFPPDVDTHTPSRALNYALDRMHPDCDAFVICSVNEVEIRADQVRTMVDRIESDSDYCLAAGYRLQDRIQGSGEIITDPSAQEGIAFKVPWNTCAAWNAQLFRQFVGQFDRICDGALGSFWLDEDTVVECEGMEDVLAQAKASHAKPDVYSVLFQEKLPWLFPEERADNQRLKLRKRSEVVRRILEARGYTEEDLQGFVRTG